MNFNGWSKGGALYTIPKGWTVEVTFINPGPVPRSLIVIEKAAVKKADEAGEYAIACGLAARRIVHVLAET